MHCVQNFWIQIHTHIQINRLWIWLDLDPTRLTTRMSTTLFWWACTKTDVWWFLYDICSSVAGMLACRVIFFVFIVTSNRTKRCWTSKTDVQYHWWNHFSTIHGSGWILPRIWPDSDPDQIQWLWIMPEPQNPLDIQIWMRCTASKYSSNTNAYMMLYTAEC